MPGSCISAPENYTNKNKFTASELSPIDQRGLKFTLSLGLSWAFSKLVVKESPSLVPFWSFWSCLRTMGSTEYFQKKNTDIESLHWQIEEVAGCWASLVKVVWMRHNGTHVTVAIPGFVAVVVGTERLKKRMCETENALVPPALEDVSSVQIQCHFLPQKVRQDLVVAKLRNKRIWLGNLKN